MSPLELVPTEDHSFTLYNSQLKSHYHSLYGALGESQYVYIESSLLVQRLQRGDNIHILEIGLGTGLNFLLTFGKVKQNPNASLHYTAYEPFPPAPSLLQTYYQSTGKLLTDLTETDLSSLIPELHPDTTTTNQFQNMNWDFYWEKWSPERIVPNSYDIIYYDAFGPFTAPELWTEECLLAAYDGLKNKGRLVTFSINSNTRRILEKYSLNFERPKGFARKREMLIIEKGY
jgi:tRNA U34 5-methylaminomethyl-2-thiouridine-forming methyltransferase MnmC